MKRINPKYLSEDTPPKGASYEIIPLNQIEGAELDEMWSFVQNKKQQRWLWLAVDHESTEIIAFTFGGRQDKVFLKFQEMLEPLGISMFYTDDWGSYLYIPEEQHTVGKRNTQIIERTNLTIRIRVKRPARKTICFSKSVFMHDTVISLFINIFAFGWTHNYW